MGEYVMDIIKSIVRRATRGDKLNIIVVGSTHERYESTLCKTGHNFFCLKQGKLWDTDYAEVPENYFMINEIPYHEEFDLILVHTSGVRIDIANDIKRYCQIPIIKHCHVLPDIRYNIANQLAAFNSDNVDHTSFISEYSKSAWNSEGSVIEHGMDTEFWCDKIDIERKSQLLSVVNYWADRDWACGWELWNLIVNNDEKLPVKVLGNNPGLSKPARGLKDLKKNYYESSIYLNTSLHSPVPMALLEAMACGCAIVSTKTCMIPEIINHGENGLLSNNIQELQGYCKELLNNPQEAKRLGDAAQKTILEKYNLSIFTNKWNNLFNEVIYK
jgi:hypothetical protein